MIDIERLEALAEAALEQHASWISSGGSWPQPNARLLEMQYVANPAAVLELIDRVKRISARLCMCRDCGGQGEVYSGNHTHQGQWQPPEPDMNICGTCGGDGVLGPLEDFEALAAERHKLKTENEFLRLHLRAFIGSAYPVSAQINQRGYNWSEVWLDEALAMTKEQL